MASMLLLPNEATRQGRCAFIAGKKLGAAPVRSRCKRVMRAVSQELGAPWSGYDVVFIARRKVSYAPHDAVVAQFRKMLEEQGVL